MKREFMEYHNIKPTSLKDGLWSYVTDVSAVRVMARSEGYAMVRFKGCMPFVVSEKNLHPIKEPT